MKYAVIDKHRSEYPVKTLCRVLEVSRSVYYAFKQAKPSLRSQEDLAMRANIVRINAAHRWAPGAVKMWHLLNAEGIKCGKHRIIRLRKLENIQTTRIKRFRSRTGAVERKKNRTAHAACLDFSLTGLAKPDSLKDRCHIWTIARESAQKNRRGQV